MVKRGEENLKTLLNNHHIQILRFLVDMEKENKTDFNPNIVSKGIDCIFTRNTKDFQKACSYLGIEVERQLTNNQFIIGGHFRGNY